MRLSDRLLHHFETDQPLLACQALVERTFPEHRDRMKPHDLFAMAARAGICIKGEDTDRFDGRFESTSNGGSTITLSTATGRSRSRFTLAHELGHWLLRENDTTSRGAVFRGVQSHAIADREEEEIADLIAAELLIPLRAVATAMQCQRTSMNLVRGLAKRFDASFMVALRRVADVTSEPLLYLNLVPHRFKDLTTYAEVDEAICAVPFQRLSHERTATRLVRQYTYDEIRRSRRIRLGVKGPFGKVVAEFDVVPKVQPVPNCDLLTTLSGSNVNPFVATE